MRVPLGPPRFVPLTAMSEGYVDAGDARRVALFASVALILDLPSAVVAEITDAVIHLATASFTTGQILNVDGGYVTGRT